MGLSSWQVLRAWTCHRQPPKNNFLYFLIELVEIYLPVPIVCFSNEKNEAPSPKYCSCKIPLYQGFFGIFENLDFGTFDHCILYSFFAGIFTVATRNWFDDANDGLWPNYIFYKQIDFLFLYCFFDFFWVQKTWENIAKSAGNANLPRIPKVYVEGRAA